jgi:hypothetical protein
MWQNIYKCLLRLVAQAVVFLSAIQITGCGSPDVDAEFLHRVNETKIRCSASRVKLEALQLVSKSGINMKTPPEISSLPFFKDIGDSSVSAGFFDDSHKILMFQQGGGVASQGIIVCLSSEAVTNLLQSNLIGTVIRWDSEVFFWADWRVLHGIAKNDLMLRRE